MWDGGSGMGGWGVGGGGGEGGGVSLGMRPSTLLEIVTLCRLEGAC